LKPSSTLSVTPGLLRRGAESPRKDRSGLQSKLVVVEPHFVDGVVNELLNPVLQKLRYPIAVIDAERSPAQKERLVIDTLEPVLNEHKLVVNKALILKNDKSTEDLPAEGGEQGQALLSAHPHHEGQGRAGK